MFLTPFFAIYCLFIYQRLSFSLGFPPLSIGCLVLHWSLLERPAFFCWTTIFFNGRFIYDIYTLWKVLLFEHSVIFCDLFIIFWLYVVCLSVGWYVVTSQEVFFRWMVTGSGFSLFSVFLLLLLFPSPWTFSGSSFPCPIFFLAITCSLYLSSKLGWLSYWETRIQVYTYWQRMISTVYTDDNWTYQTDNTRHQLIFSMDWYQFYLQDYIYSTAAISCHNFNVQCWLIRTTYGES